VLCGSRVDALHAAQHTHTHTHTHTHIDANDDPPPSLRNQAVYGGGKIVIHRRPGKLGLGTAYMDGLKLARAPFVVLMDADLSHHPKFIPEMYRWVWRTD
jgi:glycosyltransferase involved in cell wall biosynthesis